MAKDPVTVTKTGDFNVDIVEFTLPGYTDILVARYHNNVLSTVELRTLEGDKKDPKQVAKEGGVDYINSYYLALDTMFKYVVS